MQQVGRTHRHGAGQIGWLGLAIGGAALALVVSACTGGTKAGSGTPGSKASGAGHVTAPRSTPSVSTPSSSATKRVVITAPDGGSVNPAKPVTVGVKNGQLTRVTMRNAAGRRVHGAISSDGRSWHNTEDLGYASKYRIAVEAVDASGSSLTKSSQVTTLTPDNQTMPSLVRIGGDALTPGGTYGVGIVPVVHFDEPITNRMAAERALKVTSRPKVEGSWYWADNQNAHWRPKHYWPSGTTVSVSANVYGVQMGPGLYGQADRSASFKIGRRQITIARDDAPNAVNKVRVFNAANKVIRTMNTSMGMHSGVTVNGNYINFYTMDGTYTVLAHEQPARMCSASYGLPANAPGGYPCESIYNATKISTDGIYLHELLKTVWDQDHGQDVSHGCLNLNEANSMWFYTHSLVGDPVEINGARGAPTLQIEQGGDWTLPWSKWLAGSALH